MKLRRIELEQVRRFQGRVVVEGIGDGLNLIVGANEAGKTTLLAGLHAALFLKHGSSRARDLQHHRNRTAPRVAIEVEVQGERLWFEKRFLQRPQAILRAGAATLSGDAAEQAFQARLGGEAPERAPCPGLWNLLLVGQGESMRHGLEPDARGVLQASLEAQIDSVTGAGSAKHLIARLDERLFGSKGLLDRRNQKPKGRLRELEQSLADLEEQLRLLEARREGLRADVARLQELLARQADRPDDLSRQEQAIATLEAREADLLRQGERATRAARAALALNEAQSALTRRRALAGELEQRRVRLRELEDALAGTVARRDRAQADGEALAAQGRHEDAVLEAADGWQQATVEMGQVRRGAAAGATEVMFDLAEAAAASVRLNGATPQSRRFRVRVSEQLTVDAPALGRITIRPAQATGLRETLDEIAARAAAARTKLERLGAADAFDFTGLAAFAPGLAHLREARAGLADRLQEARDAFRQARDDALRATAERDAARERLADLERDLATARAGATDEALVGAVRDAAAALPEPAADGADQDGGVGLESVRAQLRTLRLQREQAQQAHAAAENELARLSERIATLQGTGLKEEIDELARRRTHLQQEHRALWREVEVARLLKDTLCAAEEEVRESYTMPLVSRLQPALDELLPGARITLDDNLHITAIERAGPGEEAFDQLSHGTREQLAVVARLAFAELLVDSGQPCFMVLDDALVFSDDDRLERMFRILERAAERVQILVLTCRERAFGGLRAKHLRIEVAAPAPV